jgi:purine-cytosine permease-like protein
MDVTGVATAEPGPYPSTEVSPDAIGQIETRGIDYIPESERHSSPLNLFWVWIGCQLAFGIIIIGALPVEFGLGWWSSLSAITVGLIIGSVLYAPMSLLGPRTGTNSAVSSGAHFGLIGRLVGSLQAMFIAIGFAALTVWLSGDALVAGLAKLFGTPETDAVKAIIYAVLSVFVVLIAIYGHATVVATQKFLIPTVGLLMVIGFFAVGGKFHTSYHGGDYLLGTFWPTWALAVVGVLSLPISYAPFANDYARYVSRKRYSNSIVMWAAGGGMFVGCWFAMVYAAYLTTTFKDVLAPFPQGLVAASPNWYVVMIMIIALLGTFAQSSLCLYGTGLDTSSLIPRLPRVRATLLISAFTVALVYVGGLLTDAEATVSAFVLILVVICAPWMLITLLGYAYCRGRYRPYDLQLFNMGKTGGSYWYTRGLNMRAIAAFVPAVIVGLLFSNTTLYKGPLADTFSGIDFSFLSASIISVALYGLFLLIWPERNHPTSEEGEVVLTRSEAEAAAHSTIGGDALSLKQLEHELLDR